MKATIAEKANTTFHLIALGFILIALRLFYLTTFEYEEQYEKAKLPKRKTRIETSHRGTVRDRFNYPLAINQIQYDAAIVYTDVREIPRLRIQKVGRKRTKHYPRKDYITELAHMLAQKLDLDPQDIEDTIHGRAALFPNTPCIIKRDIAEKTYFQLRMLERKYPGICVVRNSKRVYPMGKIAGDLMGYIGPINAEEYYAISGQINTYERFLAEREEGLPVPLPEGFSKTSEVIAALHSLKEKSYSINSLIGKRGIEKHFDQDLRSHTGYTSYEINTGGQITQELPAKKRAKPGRRLLLNLSYELQAYAEELLASHERQRTREFTQLDSTYNRVPNPWIKGGSIVAMVPHTGEVIALASYPRSDPNVFSQAPTKENLFLRHDCLETPHHIAHIWDGLMPLMREHYAKNKGGFFVEKRFLDWESYIAMVLSPDSCLQKPLSECAALKRAIDFLSTCDILLDLSEQSSMPALIDALYNDGSRYHKSAFATPGHLIEDIQGALDQHRDYVRRLFATIDPLLGGIAYNDDKLLFMDLLRLPIDRHLVSDDILEAIGEMPLSDIREASQELANCAGALKSELQTLFHSRVFLKWRDAHFHDYLKKMRETEKYQKPYTYYLHKAEKQLFSAFWKENKVEALLACYFPEASRFVFKRHITSQAPSPIVTRIVSRLSYDQAARLFPALRSFDELHAALYGRYALGGAKKRCQTLRDLAAAFYPNGGFGLSRSMSYQAQTPQGSLFKIVTGYEGLMAQYNKGNLHDLNPLTIIDELHPMKDPLKGLLLGYTMEGTPIYRKYRGGTLPRSHAPIGKTDFFTAMQQSSNMYFSLLAGDIMQQSENLRKSAEKFGFGEKTGIELPGEIAGILPKDLRYNKTGLYSFAIGQHAFSVTPLQTAGLLAAIANGGPMYAPSLLKLSAGSEASAETTFDFDSYPYKTLLEKINIYFPLFTEAVKTQAQMSVAKPPRRPSKHIYFPHEVRDYLLEALRLVVQEKKGSAHPFRIRGLYKDPTVLRDYLEMRPYFVGKTSTAEFAYRPTINRDGHTIKGKDIWFGAVSFRDRVAGKNPLLIANRWEHPELVVVVYLRFGDFGKEAAPLAAQIIKKWREIQKKEARYSYIEAADSML